MVDDYLFLVTVKRSRVTLESRHFATETAARAFARKWRGEPFVTNIERYSWDGRMPQASQRQSKADG